MIEDYNPQSPHNQCAEKNQQPIADLMYWNGCISDQSWQNVQTAILVYRR